MTNSRRLPRSWALVRHIDPFVKRLYSTNISTDCTPKAITHQIAKLRAAGGKVDADDGDTNGDEGTAKKVQKTTKSTKSTPATKKNSKGGKKQTIERTPTPSAAEYATPPESATRPSRAGSKRNYADMVSDDDAAAKSDSDDEGDDGLNKKVKIEVGEDIGEGLRAPSDGMFK